MMRLLFLTLLGISTFSFCADTLVINVRAEIEKFYHLQVVMTQDIVLSYDANQQTLQRDQYSLAELSGVSNSSGGFSVEVLSTSQQFQLKNSENISIPYVLYVSGNANIEVAAQSVGQESVSRTLFTVPASDNPNDLQFAGLQVHLDLVDDLHNFEFTDPVFKDSLVLKTKAQ